MPDLKDPRFQSDFSSNKGVNPQDNPQLKPGAKDSVGRESNTLTPLTGSVSIKGMVGFGGENKHK